MKSAPDHAARPAEFSASAQESSLRRVWSQRVLVAESRGSRSVSVYGPELPAGALVELWTVVGSLRRLLASVPGPLGEGIWFELDHFPVERWEVWASAPAVTERLAGQLFSNRERIYFCKAD